MKTYRIWIEIEEYDTRMEHSSNVEGALDFESTAEFKSIEDAVEFANTLNNLGKEMAEVAV